jgi:hypothetical protein
MKYEHKILADAIKSLRPGERFSYKKDANDIQVIDIDHLDWLDNKTPKPTKEEILAEITRLESLQYRSERSTEYPSIGDQLDDLFKAGAFSAEMAAKIQAVKDKYPKPE